MQDMSVCGPFYVSQSGKERRCVVWKRQKMVMKNAIIVGGAK